MTPAIIYLWPRRRRCRPCTPSSSEPFFSSIVLHGLDASSSLSLTHNIDNIDPEISPILPETSSPSCRRFSNYLPSRTYLIPPPPSSQPKQALHTVFRTRICVSRILQESAAPHLPRLRVIRTEQPRSRAILMADRLLRDRAFGHGPSCGSLVVLLDRPTTVHLLVDDIAVFFLAFLCSRLA